MKKIVSMTLVALPLLFLLMGQSAALSPTPLPDFAINCARDTLQTRPGWPPATFQMSLAAINGYQGRVRLTCVTFNPHVTCGVSPSWVTLGGDSVVPFVVASAADPGAKAPIEYALILNATGESSNTKGGTVSHNDTLHLTVLGQ